MRALLMVAASAALLVGACASDAARDRDLMRAAADAASAVQPSHHVAAIADPARPAADIQRDSLRKPAEMLVFAEVRPGQMILDAVPGTGYFTRLFARAVGPQGRVFAYVPSEVADKYDMKKTADALAAAYPNVESASDPLTQRAPQPFADLVWTAQNYHDFHTPLFGSPDIGEVNRAIWSVLKPGGLYVVLDHSAQPGSGLRDANTLHRIDKEAVKREVTAAGFVFEGESVVLANAADPRTANVFDPAIRGRTDQFALKFRKPRN